MNEPQHSPLPWGNDETRINDSKGAPVGWTDMYHPRTEDAMRLYIANARLIVAAVNSHAQLLAAAKEASQLLGLICEDDHEVRDALQAAIAHAEELAL